MKRNLFAALTLAFAVVVEASGAIFLDGKVCELSPRGGRGRQDSALRDRGTSLRIDRKGSRGLGSSVIPTRLFNRPELVLCALRSRKDICQR